MSHSNPDAATIYPVILSGGVGSRLWPASRRATPKQMRALVSGRTMIQETAARVLGSAPGAEFAAPTIITSTLLGEATRDQLAAAGVAPRAIIMEPEGRNTAPAAAIAALNAFSDDPHALVLLLPAGHHIANPDAFRAAIAAGAPAARAGRIVTFGVTPTGPETGYGYIRAGVPLSDAAPARVVDESAWTDADLREERVA